MVAHGHVHNGVVVLDGGARFPEGQLVTVLARGRASPAPTSSPRHSLLDIPPVSLGAVLAYEGADTDLLDEMLEDRP